MPKIIFLKGLPASNKSSWAKEQVKQGNCMRISKDDIRREMLGEYTKPKREREVVRLRNKLIRWGLEMGKSVIVDDTNLNPAHERAVRQIANEMGVAMEVNDSFLEVPVEECIRRDLRRGEKAVGASVIWEMYYKWLAPSPTKKLGEEFNKPRCIICDVDGTLALNLEGRSFYDLSRVGEDSIDPFVGCVVDALYNYGVEMDGEKYPSVIIVSGREETSREATVSWLNQNGIPFDELYMRKEGDSRKDELIKEEIYHNLIEPNYAVLGVFDDRPRVCNMWRKLGLRVAQVGNPYIWF